MSRKTRVLLIVLSALVVLFVVLYLAAYVMIHRPHPDVTGTRTLSGLRAPVTIHRDAEGIPHVYARTSDDMYFAQGYVHAQDRFWQMEFWRRIGAGRLSELFGESSLSADVFMRTMGFTEIAEQEYQRLPADVRNHLDAYARGVNAYIDSRPADRLGLEFALLGLQGVDTEIEPWRPRHTLTWLKVMSYDLSENMQTELDTLELIREVGVSQARAFYAPYRYGTMPVIASMEEIRASRRRLGLDPLASFPREPGPATARLGISGMSSTGDPGNASGMSSTSGSGNASRMSSTSGPGSASGASRAAPAELSGARGGSALEAGRGRFPRALDASYLELLAGLPTELVGGFSRMEELVLGKGGGVGSNSWVVHGDRTGSGMPLLANDTHLAIRMPSIWYEIHLHMVGGDAGGGRSAAVEDEAGDGEAGRTGENDAAAAADTAEEPLHVAGFSFPGAPGVIIGHNEDISWGFTNVAPDVQDLYIERINPADPNQYLVNGEWRDMTVRKEEIAVRGRDEPHVLMVRETRNGPVITDMEQNLGFRGFGIETPELSADSLQLGALSLRWTALEPNRTLEAVYDLNRASNFREFREAMLKFDVPAQNAVYADTDGNIGYQTPGRIPIRANGTGRLPVPGWTDEYQWQGYIPADQLPVVYNPEKGFIATANNPVIPPDYPYFIANEFDYGYRARRITDVLESGDSLTKDDMARLHGDNLNLSALEILPYVLELDPAAVAQAREDERRRDEEARENGARDGEAEEVEPPRDETEPPVSEPMIAAALNILARWDGTMEMSSAGAAVFSMFYQSLVEETFGDELPERMWSRSRILGSGSRLQNTFHFLLQDPGNAWWDDIHTLDSREDRDHILGRALMAGLERGVKRYGSTDLSEWLWADVHVAVFRNQTLGKSGISIIERLFNRGPVGTSGGLQQVNSADWDLTEPFQVAHVSSMRQIIDMDALDTSRLMHTTGQSGHPYHPHYGDFIDRWRLIQYHAHRWRTSPEAGDAEATLTLQPRPRD